MQQSNTKSNILIQQWLLTVLPFSAAVRSFTLAGQLHTQKWSTHSGLGVLLAQDSGFSTTFVVCQQLPHFSFQGLLAGLEITVSVSVCAYMHVVFT